MTTSPHARAARFELGALVAHVDAPEQRARVARVYYVDGVPFYDLHDLTLDELVPGVLCTVDLIPAPLFRGDRVYDEQTDAFGTFVEFTRYDAPNVIGVVLFDGDSEPSEVPTRDLELAV